MSTSDASLPRLDDLAIATLSFFINRIGYGRKPSAVALIFIIQGLQYRGVMITQKQLRNRITKLISLGMLEKWTTKHPSQFKITYYRVPYLIKGSTITNIPSQYKNQENQATNPPTIPNRTHRLSASGEELKAIWKGKGQLYNT